VLERFKDHITKDFPELQNSMLLVACSGGLDSVVLTHLCVKANLTIALAHCNFGLRGTESNEDQRFVEMLASALHIPFYSTHFDTPGYVKEKKVSVQVAARELRYTWFNDLLKEESVDYVATAHHLDDSLETFIINLSRGTGIEGLKGIPEKSGQIVRPMLPFARAEIHAYAQEEQLQWREDSSNKETKYVRNKVRHQIVPLFKEVHPTFLENFKTTQRYLKDSATILENHLREVKQRLFKPYENGFKISIEALTTLQPIMGYLHGLFNAYGFTAWKDIESLLTSMSGKEITSATHRIIKDREHILLQRITGLDTSHYEVDILKGAVKEPVSMWIEIVTEITETGNSILYVDKETLNSKLTVRKCKKGDYFYPLGLQGKKKVSKFFKDEKMDTVAKENQWLLCSGDDIVWIIGRRGDDRFKVTPNTKKIVKFTVAE
jgi:tRNA(Ile)-lysidine synthase